MNGCYECDGILTGRQKKYCGSGCKKRSSRRAWISRTYGLTLEDYDRVLEFQGGVCYICHKKPNVGAFLHVDHEHGGHVRGLLCGYCNSRLVGRLKDHSKAQRLADYLRNPPAVTALGREVIAPGRPKKKRSNGRRRSSTI